MNLFPLVTYKHCYDSGLMDHKIKGKIATRISVKERNSAI